MDSGIHEIASAVTPLVRLHHHIPYPLSFLKEVREKTGSGALFSSGQYHNDEFHAMLNKYCWTSSGYVGELDPVGSLLPFGAGGGYTAPGLQINSVEHPPVSRWIIE